GFDQLYGIDSAGRSMSWILTPTKKSVESLPLDMYGTIVGGLAYGREEMYRRARQVLDVGVDGIGGRNGFIVVGIIALIIGLALIIFGAVTHDETMVAVGVFIFIIGVALIVGGYTDAEIAVLAGPISIPLGGDGANSP